MRRPLTRVILWLGAAFVLVQLATYVHQAHSGYPGQESQSTAIRPKGDGQKAAAIKEAFRFSWDSYEKYAFPYDTLRPLEQSYENDRNGWGATAVDGLSTAIIMNERETVDKILRQIAKTDFTRTATDDERISLFESTIRYLGGLVSEPRLRDILLEKAINLADSLSIAFDTPSGVPDDEVIFNPEPRRYGNPDSSITCIGTLVLEWTRLSDLTGNGTYAALAQRAQAHLMRPKPEEFRLPGLVGTYVRLSDGVFEDYQAGWGGGSDSYYEYLIKMYAYDPVAFVEYKESWVMAAESSMQHLASHPTTRTDLTFLGEFRGNSTLPMSSHLASVCGGSFILGGLLLQNQVFVDFGLELAKSYYEVYRQSPSGIGPEAFHWVDDHQPLTKPAANRPPPKKWGSFYESSGFWPTNSEYILRPETIESLYYAYRATGDKQWQDWAWEAFEALDRMTRVEGGFGGLHNVMKKEDIMENKDGQRIDKMESFWLAETLKYLYLTFAEEAEYQVTSDGRMKYVLNTEAHPIRVRR
ncbi:hypothetical protein FZEAL_5658 [Fusarium zealandicum]|uniref:alpha-1,2-Mannosidase n=1 Tax=Fusarium zealandicum TaxID=1053134 RepID=A0A8H4UK77_9HYPO|nr:hypothetical protein FZEAL_5658 [Fusarium zealandicum]